MGNPRVAAGYFAKEAVYVAFRKCCKMEMAATMSDILRDVWLKSLISTVVSTVGQMIALISRPSKSLYPEVILSLR